MMIYHIIAVLVYILGLWIAWRIIRSIFLWGKRIYLCIKNDQPGKAVKLLGKGLGFLLIIVGAFYLIEAIAVVIVALLVFKAERSGGDIIYCYID